MPNTRLASSVLWDMDRVSLTDMCQLHKIDPSLLAGPLKERLHSFGYGKHFQDMAVGGGVPLGAFVRYLIGKDQVSIDQCGTPDVASKNQLEQMIAHFAPYPSLDELVKDRVTRLRLTRMVAGTIDRVVTGGDVLPSATPTPQSLSADPTPVSHAAAANSHTSFPSEPREPVSKKPLNDNTPTSTSSPAPQQTVITPVSKWLQSHAMGMYAPAFHTEGFDELEDLKTVAFAAAGTPHYEAFCSIVPRLGHREKIKRLVSESIPTREWVERLSNPAADDPLGSPTRSEADSHRPSTIASTPAGFVDGAIVAMGTRDTPASGVLPSVASPQSTPSTSQGGIDLSQFVKRAPTSTVRVNGRPIDKRLLVATRGLRNPQSEGLKFCSNDRCLRRHLQFVTPSNRKDSPFELCAVNVDAPPQVLECDDVHAGFVRVKFKGRYGVWSLRWLSEMTEGLSRLLEDRRGRNRLIVCEEATCTFRERCSSGHFEVPIDGVPRGVLDFGSTTALQLILQQQWIDKVALVKAADLKRGADDRSSLATEEYLALLEGDDAEDHSLSLHQHANKRNNNMSGLPVMRPSLNDCLAGTCDSFHFFGLCGRGSGCPYIHLAPPTKSKLIRNVFLRVHYDNLIEHFQSGEHQTLSAGNKLRPRSHQHSVALLDDVASLKDRMARRRKFISVSEVGDVLVGTTCQVCRAAMFQLIKEVFNRTSCSLLGALCGRYGVLRMRKDGRDVDGTDADIEDLMWNVRRYLMGVGEPIFEGELALHECILLINRAVMDAIQNHAAWPPRWLPPGQLQMQPEIPVYWDFENILITDKEELQLFISCVRTLLCGEGIAFAESRVRIKAFGTQSVFNNVVDFVRDMQVEMVLVSDRKSEEVDRSIEKSIRETVFDPYRGAAFPAFVLVTSDKDSIGIAEEGRAMGKQVYFIHDAPKGGSHERVLAKASTGLYSLMDVYLSPFTKPQEDMVVLQPGAAHPPRQHDTRHEPREDPPAPPKPKSAQEQQRVTPKPINAQPTQQERNVMSFFQSTAATAPNPTHVAQNLTHTMLREASGARAGAGSLALNFGATPSTTKMNKASQPSPAPAVAPAPEPKVTDLIAMALKKTQPTAPAQPQLPVPKSQAVKGVLGKGTQQATPAKQASPTPSSPSLTTNQKSAGGAPVQQHSDPALPALIPVDTSNVMGVLDATFLPKRTSVSYYLLLVDALMLRILDLRKLSEDAGPRKTASMVRGPFKYTLPGRAKGQFDSKGAKIGGSANLDPSSASANGGGGKGKGKGRREDAMDRLNAETFEGADETKGETADQKAAIAAYKAMESEYQQNVLSEAKSELTQFLEKSRAVMPQWFSASLDKGLEKRCLGELTKSPDAWLDMRDVVRRYPTAGASAILKRKKGGLSPMVEMDAYRNALSVLRVVGNMVEGSAEGLPQPASDVQRVVLQPVD